ncbi:MAG: hypothetical protein IPP43_06060 [Chitinophagaceae bacterium]|nr:hypothetical protein [Chitinophagaceae bacterium]
MSKESFEIVFRKDFDPTFYRATVEITSRSENIIRFEIKAGTKVLQMEKLLFRKSNQWKIKRMSFDIKGNSKVNAKLMMDIQKAIDFQLKKL